MPTEHDVLGTVYMKVEAGPVITVLSSLVPVTMFGLVTITIQLLQISIIVGGGHDDDRNHNISGAAL